MELPLTRGDKHASPLLDHMSFYFAPSGCWDLPTDGCRIPSGHTFRRLDAAQAVFGSYSPQSILSTLCLSGSLCAGSGCQWPAVTLKQSFPVRPAPSCARSHCGAEKKASFHRLVLKCYPQAEVCRMQLRPHSEVDGTKWGACRPYYLKANPMNPL